MSDTNLNLYTGRLTKDITAEKTRDGLDVAHFTIACERMKKPNQEKADVDFFRCVAWRQTAKYLSQYAHKGDRVFVEGVAQTDSYEKNGVKIYTQETVANKVNILSHNTNTQGNSKQRSNEPKTGDYEGFDTGLNDCVTEDDLPF